MRIDLDDKVHIKNKIQELIQAESIHLDDIGVAGRIGLMFAKAQNNLKYASTTLKISNEVESKLTLELQEKDTFYDWVIIASYYAMFHAAHALLATKKIRIRDIRVHEATLYAFANYFIINGELALDIFLIYEDAEAKAEQLFNSLSEERSKRSEFTYKRLPKANQEPAEESLKNANEFVTVIGNLLRNRKFI